MPDAFQDMFATLLASFGESVSYIPAGGEEANRVTLTAVVRRQRATVEQAADGRRRAHVAIVQVANHAHAVYGGFASEPAAGLKFKLKVNPGDASAVDGWVAGDVQAARGKWMITCTYIPDRLSVGGHENSGIGAAGGRA